MKMRSGIVTQLIVVVLCAGITAGQPEQITHLQVTAPGGGDGTAWVESTVRLPDAVVKTTASNLGTGRVALHSVVAGLRGAANPNDPNDPNEPAPAADANEPWDPAEHLVANWDQVSLTSRLYNPEMHPDTDPEEQRSLSVSVEIAVIDPNGLIGVFERPVGLVVLDQDGVEVATDQDDWMGPRWYHAPRTMMRPVGFGQLVEEIRPYHISLGIPVDPNRGYPVSLSRIEWSTYALITNEVNEVDVPFAPADEWVELVPGLDILVEEASVTEGSYSYKIKAKYNRARVAYSGGFSIHVWRDEKPPETIVLEMDVLDAEGRSIRELGGGGFSGGSSGTGSGDEMTYTSTGRGSCAACGEATTIRYRIARKATEIEASFVLEDVPVPDF
jgi:hypothetical protein